jgi:FkbM family methyltransferase
MTGRAQLVRRIVRTFQRGSARRLIRPLARLVRPWLHRRGRIVAGPVRGYRFPGGGDVLSGTYESMLVGTYESEVQDFLVRTLKASFVFYDVGAHYGYFTLLGSKLVTRGGHVFSFEPSPRNAQRLRRVIELNELANVTAVAAAISDRCGAADLYMGGTENHYRPSLLPVLFSGDEGEHVTVETTTLDAFGTTHAPPDVVKIDVEGAELRVLKGALGLVDGPAPPVFIVETHSRDLDRAVQELLAAHRYDVRGLGGDPRRRHVVAVPCAGYDRLGVDGLNGETVHGA